jgi:diphthine-ammonia ligase
MAYLWRQDQSELLDSMIKNGMDIRLVKVCSMGLNEQHLMQNVVEL